LESRLLITTQFINTSSAGSIPGFGTRKSFFWLVLGIFVFWILDITFWPLVFGFWLLDFGFDFEGLWMTIRARRQSLAKLQWTNDNSPDPIPGWKSLPQFLIYKVIMPDHQPT